LLTERAKSNSATAVSATAIFAPSSVAKTARRRIETFCDAGRDTFY
jgi:hypothetical protein